MRGSVVRRRSDPVHTGVVTSVNWTWKTCTVRWCSSNVLEFLISIEELETAEEWK
jgi:hypothetical protein